MSTAPQLREHWEQRKFPPSPSNELYLPPPGWQLNHPSFCNSWKTFPTYMPRCSTQIPSLEEITEEVKTSGWQKSTNGAALLTTSWQPTQDYYLAWQGDKSQQEP